jgi:hypothetical protein
VFSLVAFLIYPIRGILPFSLGRTAGLAYGCITVRVLMRVAKERE